MHSLYFRRRVKVKKLLIYFVLTFLSILTGFFSSVAISTILGQTGDWAILSSALLSALIEVISKIFYSSKNLNRSVYGYRVNLLSFINNLKIGLVYGFFVEAFKLGS
jgi:hypothetical protein